MSQDTSMQKVSFYSATMWKAIFDGLTKMLEDREETSFTLVTYGPTNFVRDSIGEDGEIDSGKLYSNIGCYFECDPVTKDDLVNPLIREKVSFAALERIDYDEDGKNPRMRCCFAIDAKDAEKARIIADQVNRGIEYANDLVPRSLSDYCSERQVNLCGVDRIDEGLVKTMRAEGMLNFPHSFIKTGEETYVLRLPAQYRDEAQEALKKAVILHSGLNREFAEKDAALKKSLIADALSKAVDDGKSYVIVDATRPDHYIRTDSHGIHVIVRTRDDREQELRTFERNAPRLQERVYGVISDYGNPVAVATADKNFEAAIEKIREEAKEQKELGLSDKVAYYKRSFTSHIMECLERASIREPEMVRVDDSRLRDNDYAMSAAIDHAVINKQDTLAGDLKSDKDLNMRAIDKVVPETAIDLSDLNGGDTFEQVFCQQLIGPAGFTDLDERRSFEESIIHSEAFTQLCEETEEIKEIVMREIKETYDEVMETDYEFTDITRAEYARELDEFERESVEIHMDLETDMEYEQ